MADLEAGFAKLQGEDFEYYMQTYSIILGRNSKKSAVDVDLTSLGGGMNISRQHARIYYDFQMRRFQIEIIGKNGCSVNGQLVMPANSPVRLKSQDLLQIGEKKFYFLLPVRSILRPPHQPLAALPPPGFVSPMPALPAPPTGKKRGGRPKNVVAEDDSYPQKKSKKMGNGIDNNNGVRAWPPHDVVAPSYGSIQAPLAPNMKTTYHYSGYDTKVGDTRRRVDNEADVAQQMQAEEKDVVSAVATVLSDLCGPGEWMPMKRLHAELLEHYSGIWHQSRIRKFLTSDDWPESKGQPWIGLLSLLRKYPEHFVIHTRTIKGKTPAVFVSLVSLLT